MPKKAPTPQPPELVRQIEREVLAPGFLADLERWTDRQCARLLSIENRSDPHKATEMIHGAVVDTCDGIRSWSPERRTLQQHLEQVINSRLWHECERARVRRHIPFDVSEDSQDESPAAVEMSLRHEDVRARPDGRLSQREVRDRLYEHLDAVRDHRAPSAPRTSSTAANVARSKPRATEIRARPTSTTSAAPSARGGASPRTTRASRTGSGATASASRRRRYVQ